MCKLLFASKKASEPFCCSCTVCDCLWHDALTRLIKSTAKSTAVLRQGITFCAHAVSERQPFNPVVKCHSISDERQYSRFVSRCGLRPGPKSGDPLNGGKRDPLYYSGIAHAEQQPYYTPIVRVETRCARSLCSQFPDSKYHSALHTVCTIVTISEKMQQAGCHLLNSLAHSARGLKMLSALFYIAMNS